MKLKTALCAWLLIFAGVLFPLSLLLDKLVWGEIRLQGVFTADNDATEAAMRLVEATGFPAEEMVSHVFPLEETERCIRAVGGEIADLYPIKALIKP